MTLPTRAALSLTVLVFAAAVAAAGARPTATGAGGGAPAASAATSRLPAASMQPAAPRRVVAARPMSSAWSTPPRSRPRPAATPRPATPQQRHRHRQAPSGPTGWPALNAAIHRIPTYHAGAARWVVSARYGHWGTADWYHDVLYIAPSVPSQRLYDVAVHEWSHELSVLDYGGDVSAAVHAMRQVFGGPGLTGAERAADCMAILQGATWTHYTGCHHSRWRRAAARLVHGRRL